MKLPIVIVETEKHLDLKRTARDERLKLRYTIKKIAERMGVAPSFLCDLELGRRYWNDELVEKFNKALKAS